MARGISWAGGKAHRARCARGGVNRRGHPSCDRLLGARLDAQVAVRSSTARRLDSGDRSPKSRDGVDQGPPGHGTAKRVRRPGRGAFDGLGGPEACDRGVDVRPNRHGVRKQPPCIQEPDSERVNAAAHEALCRPRLQLDIPRRQKDHRIRPASRKEGFHRVAQGPPPDDGHIRASGDSRERLRDATVSTSEDEHAQARHLPSGSSPATAVTARAISAYGLSGAAASNRLRKSGIQRAR